MRGCELRSGVNWSWVLKGKTVKQAGVKQGLGVVAFSGESLPFCVCWLPSILIFPSHSSDWPLQFSDMTNFLSLFLCLICHFPNVVQFHLEVGSRTFLRNIGVYLPNYIVSHPRPQYEFQSSCGLFLAAESTVCISTQLCPVLLLPHIVCVCVCVCGIGHEPRLVLEFLIETAVIQCGGWCWYYCQTDVRARITVLTELCYCLAEPCEHPQQWRWTLPY
jgi:hypothetical protein